MILCIGVTPAIQRVMVFKKFVSDAVNRAARTQEGAAGKSINVAKVLKSLGEEPLAIGFIGGDRGEFIKQVLERKSIQTDFVTVTERTRECITVIDESRATITELVEESQHVPDAAYEETLAKVHAWTSGTRSRESANVQAVCRAVVMSGTITPGGPANFYRRCVERAHGAGALSIVDAHGPSLEEALKGRPGLVKPNRAELAGMLGKTLKDEAAIVLAMRELHSRGAQRVVITAGKEPALAFDGQILWRIQAPGIKVVNPIGSGDAFTAGLVWRLLRGDDLGEACRWGAACGAANALTLMPGEVEDVQRLVQEVTVEEVNPALDRGGRT